jgi:hypothetical protein
MTDDNNVMLLIVGYAQMNALLKARIRCNALARLRLVKFVFTMTENRRRN